MATIGPSDHDVLPPTQTTGAPAKFNGVVAVVAVVVDGVVVIAIVIVVVVFLLTASDH